MSVELFSLKGRTAFISGASGHLGSAMAAALGAAGAHLIVNGRNEDKLDAFAETLRKQNISVETAAFDIRDKAAVDALFGRLDSENRALHVIINNAYTGRAASWTEATDEDFETAFRSGVTAAFNIIRAAHSCMARAGGKASVINIASMYGHLAPDPGVYGETGLNSPPHYNAAKGALIQLTRHLATHLAADGIRVNAISPGPFPTQDVQSREPEFMARLAAKTPMGRIGVASEITGAALFLASDASSYVTGINLPVDGGWSTW